MQCNRFAKFLEHSSLGNHFIDLLNFRELTDLSLVNPLKFSKNSKSTTANIRMLGDCSAMESLKSNSDSNMESLDSRDSTDSTLCVESNKIDSVCGTHPKEASSGERESVREGEGSDFRVCLQLRGKSRSKILSLSSPSLENGKLENGSLVEDSKELEDFTLDFTLCVESTLDSRIFNKTSNFKSSLDSSFLKDSNKVVESLKISLRQCA